MVERAAERPKVIMQFLAVIIVVVMVSLLLCLRYLLLAHDTTTARLYSAYVCRIDETASGFESKDGSDKSSDAQAVRATVRSTATALEQWPTELELGFETADLRVFEPSDGKSEKASNSAETRDAKTVARFFSGSTARI